MKFYNDNGFVFRIKDMQNADKVLWILSRNHGLIRCIAKGIKKSTSKKAGHLDYLNLIKFSASKTNDLDYITEVRLLNSFQILKTAHPYVFLYLSELLHATIIDEFDTDKIFSLLKTILINTDTQQIQKAVVYFELNLLKYLGFEPDLFHFQDSLKKLTLDATIYLNTTKCGYVQKGITQISTKIIKIQRIVLSNTFELFKNVEVTDSEANILQNINRTWLQNMLNYEFKTLKYFCLSIKYVSK